MPDLYFFATPRETYIVLTLDTGVIVEGEPCDWQGRQDAQRLTLPSGTPTQGALLHAECDGHTTFEGRGIVECDTDEPYFIYDDIHLQPVPAPPEPPVPPNPNQDPFAIITRVYDNGNFDLATKEGCGAYTEACVAALHTEHSEMWGHIRKTQSQNNWQGHAIDALQILARAGETSAGIYDIILSTESPDAEPAWSYKGPPDPNLWYYGPMPCPPA